MKGRLTLCVLLLCFVVGTEAATGFSRSHLHTPPRLFLVFAFLHVLAAIIFTSYYLRVLPLICVFLPYSIAFSVVSLLWVPLNAALPLPIASVADPVFQFIMLLDVFGAALLYCLGRVQSFRRRKDRPMPLWPPLAYSAAMAINLVL